MTLLERVEPTLGAEEPAYRRHFFTTDKVQAKASALLCLALILIVFFFEVRIAPADRTMPIVLVRSIFFLFTIAVFTWGRRIKTPPMLDAATLIWSVLLANGYSADHSLSLAMQANNYEVGRSVSRDFSRDDGVLVG